MLDLFDESTQIVKRLDEAQIPYALAGGLAYSVWVEARNTEDIDLLIREEDWERAAASVEPLGCRGMASPMDFATVRIRRLTKIEGRDAMAESSGPAGKP